MKPMIALLMLNIAILTVWTTVDPLRHETIVVSQDPFRRDLETYGICSSDHGAIFVATLCVVNLGLLLFALFQAYEARSTSSEFQESGCIFLVMAFLLLVSFIGTPVIIIARDNVAAYCFLMAGIIFAICTTTLLLMFVPKIKALKALKALNASGGKRAGRGLRDTVHSGAQAWSPAWSQAWSTASFSRQSSTVSFGRQSSTVSFGRQSETENSPDASASGMKILNTKAAQAELQKELRELKQEKLELELSFEQEKRDLERLSKQEKHDLKQTFEKEKRELEQAFEREKLELEQRLSSREEER